MENEKKKDQTAEIKDEELDQVSGGDGGSGGGCVICGRKDRPLSSSGVCIDCQSSRAFTRVSFEGQYHRT